MEFLSPLATTSPWEVLTLGAFVCVCGATNRLIVTSPASLQAGVSLDVEKAVEGAVEAVTGHHHHNDVDTQQRVLLEVYKAVREGADAFLFAEYRICMVFLVLFGIVILVLVSHVGTGPKGVGAANPDGFQWSDGGFTALMFFIGGTTSILSGYIGMTIAVYSNARTTISAIPDGAPGYVPPPPSPPRILLPLSQLVPSLFVGCAPR